MIILKMYFFVMYYISIAFCFVDSRGFMTQNGQPDNPRSSRYILKDFVNGKLLYCHAPPGVSQEKFHKFIVKKRARIPENTPIAQRAISVCVEILFCSMLLIKQKKYDCDTWK